VSWWRVDEQTAGQVVASAAASAGRYVTAQGDVAESAGVLSAALSNSGIVAAAVEGWMSGCGVPGLREVRELTGTVISCAGDALGVYRDGDFVMPGMRGPWSPSRKFRHGCPVAVGRARMTRSGSGGADMRTSANTFGVRHLGFEGVW